MLRLAWQSTSARISDYEDKMWDLLKTKKLEHPHHRDSKFGILCIAMQSIGDNVSCDLAATDDCAKI